MLRSNTIISKHRLEYKPIDDPSEAFEDIFLHDTPVMVTQQETHAGCFSPITEFFKYLMGFII